MTRRWIEPGAAAAMARKDAKRSIDPCKCGHPWGVHGATQPLCLVAGCECGAYDGNDPRAAKEPDHAR